MDQARTQWLPMQAYLERLHAELESVNAGEVAQYIPELARVDPDLFGIALVTVDGNVYQVGDSREPFTVQSVAKPLAYGIALEDSGIDRVIDKIAVEPSGEAFNAISLEPDSGRPFNPMINSGAIATTGLIRADTPGDRVARILDRFERYTGHPVTINEAVYQSERDTGHRNRAISHLLRNANILRSVPEEVLDVYFRQCAINVTARDLALVGACLANTGVNPITGVVALQRPYVEKVLSVMSTCGMYDYSGSWVFSVGMPAKSGVGGGIMAVLPGQFGLGVFSPPLDAKGNSVRGIRVCEALSHDFGLHLFNVARSTSSSVLRVHYDARAVSSQRLRPAGERAILQDEGHRVRVFELQGQLMFGATDSLLRTVAESPATTRWLILDFSRVVDIDQASGHLLADLAVGLHREGRTLLITGTDDKYAFRRGLKREAADLDIAAVLRFNDRDRALEWCEDALLSERSEARDREREIPLEEQYLCEGLQSADLARLRGACHRRVFAAGEIIFRAGDPGDNFYLIVAGRVDIVVRSSGKKDRRLVTIRAGMSFGEFALVTEEVRSAEAIAVVETVCLEVSCVDIEEGLKARLLARVARELARRLSKEARQLQVLGARA